MKWTPDSAAEILLYVATVIIIIIIVRLFHYNAIERKVKQTSRCLREKTKGSRSGQYSVFASNDKNEKMYKVIYDMNSKSYAVECDCEEGSTVNQFRNIPVYDLRDLSNPHKTISSKVCQCTNDVVTGSRTYYSGYPGLIRYMNYKDSSFFDKDY